MDILWGIGVLVVLGAILWAMVAPSHSRGEGLFGLWMGFAVIVWILGVALIIYFGYWALRAIQTYVENN